MRAILHKNQGKNKLTSSAVVYNNLCVYKNDKTCVALRFGVFWFLKSFSTEFRVCWTFKMTHVFCVHVQIQSSCRHGITSGKFWSSHQSAAFLSTSSSTCARGSPRPSTPNSPHELSSASPFHTIFSTFCTTGSPCLSAPNSSHESSPSVSPFDTIFCTSSVTCARGFPHPSASALLFHTIEHLRLLPVPMLWRRDTHFLH